MKIQIDIAHAPAEQLTALLAAMMAYGALTPDRLAEITAPWDMPKAAPTTQWQTVIREMPISKLLQFFTEHASSLATDELSRLIADLNAELYSRRIPHDDDPAAGVAQTVVIDTSARMGGPTSHAGGEPVDLSSVFAQAQDDDFKSKEAFVKEQLGEPFVAGQIPLDKSGLPWDARIHSASKAVIADGTWRQKRGVDPALVATVAAQLRQAMSVGAPAATSSATEFSDAYLGGEKNDPEPEVETPVEKFVPMLMDTHGRIIPPPPPRRQAATPTAIPEPASAPVSDTSEIDTFPRLLKFITEQKLAGKLAQTQVAAALTALGIEGPLPVLQARPDLIPAMVAKLRAIGGV